MKIDSKFIDFLKEYKKLVDKYGLIGWVDIYNEPCVSKHPSDDIDGYFICLVNNIYDETGNVKISEVDRVKILLDIGIDVIDRKTKKIIDNANFLYNRMECMTRPLSYKEKLLKSKIEDLRIGVVLPIEFQIFRRSLIKR